eukprot:TRINITY_DN3419_c0_g3_i1.p1 TRINITY_DN3419_c0_g3~~TRINITY_DN3419_c0_g3_i1.p1  ORF type:complete len:212 (+),score=31.41 TRINITY_DN3419_c0_g3_i1:286-921(+)
MAYINSEENRDISIDLQTIENQISSEHKSYYFVNSELEEELTRNKLEYIYKQEYTLDGTKHFHLNYENDDWKIDTLRDLLGAINHPAIIYFADIEKCHEIKAKLNNDGFNIEVFDPFETDEIPYSQYPRIVFTSSTYGRSCNRVEYSRIYIFYDMPSIKNYSYCCGTSGKFGRRNVVIILYAGEDQLKKLQEIESYYDIYFTDLPFDISDL